MHLVHKKQHGAFLIGFFNGFMPCGPLQTMWIVAVEMGYGTNVIEFTPEKTGTFQYTCWMGMISGKIKVVE